MSYWLSQGGTVNAADENGYTALHWAACKLPAVPSLPAISVADPSHVDAERSKFGRGVLGIAILELISRVLAPSGNGHVGIVRRLLDEGANARAVTKRGRSGMEMAEVSSCRTCAAPRISARPEKAALPSV